MVINHFLISPWRAFQIMTGKNKALATQKSMSDRWYQLLQVATAATMARAPSVSSMDMIFSNMSDYSLFFVSMMMVTGPSLVRLTFMSAPNSPWPTGRPIALLSR